MISAAVIIKSLSACFLLLGLCFFTGRLFYYNFTKKKSAAHTSFFQTTFTGFLLIISVYAIIVTGGKTILLPVPLLLVIARLIKRKDMLLSGKRVKLKR